MCIRDGAVAQVGPAGGRGRAVGELQRRGDAPEALLLLDGHLGTRPHHQVRLEAVVALGWSKEGAAIEVATEVLNYDFGLQLEIALKSCMRSLKQYWLPAFMKGELLFNNNKKQLGFFLAHAPEINIQTLKKIALSLPD